MFRRSENRRKSARRFRHGARMLRRENFAIQRGGWRL